MNENAAIPAGAAARALEHFKIYGERNCGTRFVSHLLKSNFEFTPRDASNADFAAERERLIEGLSEHEWLIKRIASERFNTVMNRALMPKTMGWKHGCPQIEFLKSVPNRTSRTLFVIVVKHPVFWALSFQKRPYESYFRYTSMSFSDYIRHVFIPTERDNVSEVIFESTIALYAAKIDGYRRLADMGVALEIVRYEEILQDPPGFLDRLGDKYSLARRRKRDIIREHSTKGDDKTLADYQEKYRLERVKDLLDPDDYDFIIATFGKDRLAWLGYPEP